MPFLIAIEYELFLWYNPSDMNILIDQIFENKEAAALPGLLESGGLPALVSGLSAVHRANLAAAAKRPSASSPLSPSPRTRRSRKDMSVTAASVH